MNLPKFVSDPYQKMDNEEIIVTKNKINMSNKNKIMMI